MTVRINKPAINLREELADLRKPSGTAGEAMLRAETPQEQFNLIGAGRRNLIINGACNISQRGDFTTASSASDETYYLDRFEQNLGSVTANKQHITSNQPSALSNTKSWRLTATSTAAGFMGIRQTIEDYKLFNGREFTASVWVKTNHPSVRFYIFDGSTTVQGKKTAVADGEWHYLQETFTFDAASGTKFSIEVISLSEAGSVTSITTGDYIEFTGFQVELGKVATPFEHRSYGEELALCQRFYYKTDTIIHIIAPRYSGSAGDGNAWWKHPVYMRTAPAMSYHGTWYATSGYGGAPTFGNNTKDGVALTTSVSTTANGVLYLTGGQISGDAEL